MSLRNLSRFRSYLVNSISDLKRKSIAVLDQVFPEYASVFTDIFGKASRELLKSLNLPSDYEALSSHKPEEVLSSITMKKKATRAINSLSEKAGRSFGISFCKNSFSFQLKLLQNKFRFHPRSLIRFNTNKPEAKIIPYPGLYVVSPSIIVILPYNRRQ